MVRGIMKFEVHIYWSSSPLKRDKASNNVFSQSRRCIKSVYIIRTRIKKLQERYQKQFERDGRMHLVHGDDSISW